MPLGGAKAFDLDIYYPDTFCSCNEPKINELAPLGGVFLPLKTWPSNVCLQLAASPLLYSCVWNIKELCLEPKRFN